MHQIPELLSPSAVIGDHYLVINLIGTGGFSAVYLVQDQQREGSFFALKEVLIDHKEERKRLTFEYTLLERLDHPALPRVHKIFSDEAHNRLYMLMDYVEGPNLEMLRLIQAEKRFSFPVITAVLAPIVDAIVYLHQQDPPVIHRDVKPSNIIVPVAGEKTILVDFGISKVYDAEGTTSEVRHGSLGYGAPEHYSTGTSTRTDIYGLGATLYTLLTGNVPPDSLDRMTKLSNENPDPLRPASELVPSIPWHISRAIERAMAIKMTQRFATVQEFWQALQGESGQQPPLTEALNSIAVTPSTSEIADKTGETFTQPLQEKQLPDGRSRKRFLLPVFLVFIAFLMIIGVGASLRNSVATPAGRTAATVERSTLTPILHPTVATTATFNPNLYPHLAASYYGTIDDLQANVPSQMTLTQMQQKDGQISGSFSALHLTGTYSGVLDTSKHIYFTTAANGGRAPLYFWGSVEPDGELTGEFCEIDQAGRCLSNGVFGVWGVAPGTAPEVKLS